MKRKEGIVSFKLYFIDYKSIIENGISQKSWLNYDVDRKLD